VIELLGMFAGGLLGSAHCVGMCGGFAAIVGASPRSLPSAVTRQLTYSFGRVFTYTFLGGMGGYFGLYMGSLESVLSGVQRAFSISAGLLMILIGAMTLGLIRLRWRWLTSLGTAAAPVFRTFLNGRGRAGVFLAGVVNGFLPCGLVLAFLALTVAAGNPLRGMLIMFFFGLGTIPAMTVVGCGSTLLSHGVRIKVYRVAACFVIVAGAMSIKRAWPTAAGASCCDGHAPTIPVASTGRPISAPAAP
jgi:sulfite exporter TauE/SafE